jgi:hypothetical protein
MRRLVKVKATHLLTRKAALSASAASRRPFPAWISAEDSGVSFSARAGATPRVRDGLVLRRVSKKKAAGRKGAPAPEPSNETDSGSDVNADSGNEAEPAAAREPQDSLA